ncbi:MAG: aryl-sulfate sulfotransferase [Gemmatimonadetes bacterium]|nr:aryl-sulfate sulfotransferase [Gemmatimonadota bacterium]
MRYTSSARKLLSVIGAGMLLAACTTEPAGIALPKPPQIASAVAAADEHNVLSAQVTVGVSDADSVAVRFNLRDEPTAVLTVTPAVPVTGASVSVPVLGLIPDRQYVFRAVAYGMGGATLGESLNFVTGALPTDLPRFIAGGSNPAPGYVVFAAGRYGLVIDNTGRVVWYRKFENGAGLNFMAQPTGRYVVRPPTTEVGDIEPWLELDPLGDVTRTLTCAGNLQPRPHDLILQPDGSYWVLCDETRTMDLTQFGGVAAARVTGTIVQHVAGSGTLLFQWSPFEHFEITDLEPAERTGADVNWTHGNALDLDLDGNIIVSFRSLSEVTKIDVHTGSVIWRMGGRRNQFTFVDTEMPAFAHQHGVRAYAPHGILLLDNLGDPTESWAERFVVDEATRTARLTRSYGAIPGAITQIGGSTQDLADGHTLVSFGTAGRVEEYDASGNVAWRIEGNAGYVFRAQRIQSLYKPGVGSAR